MPGASCANYLPAIFSRPRAKKHENHGMLRILAESRGSLQPAGLLLGLLVQFMDWPATRRSRNSLPRGNLRGAFCLSRAAAKLLLMAWCEWAGRNALFRKWRHFPASHAHDLVNRVDQPAPHGLRTRGYRNGQLLGGDRLKGMKQGIE